MLYQQFDKLENENIILLRAGGFEIASSKMRTRLPSDIIDGPSIINVFNGNELQGKSFDKWIGWVNFKTIDWRDRYYWKQRVTGWLSINEQRFDLVNS